MDRGPRERQEAEKVKAAIARNRYKRRRRFSRSSYGSASENDRIQTALSDEVLNDNEPQTPGQTSNAPSELPSMMSFSATSNDGLLADMLTWSDETRPVTHGIGVSFPQLPSMTSPFTDLSEFQHTNEFQWDHNHFSGGELLDSSPRSIDMEVTLLGHNELQTETPGALANTMGFASTDQMRGLGISTPLVPNPPSDTISSSNPGIYTGLLSTDRAMYLSYYLGTVAHAQFSLDGSHKTGNHEWLYFILFCSGHVMQISLVLSKAYCCFAKNSGQVANSDEYRNHVLEMRKSLPVPIPATSGSDRQQERSLAIVACTSLLQAMYLEVSILAFPLWRTAVFHTTKLALVLTRDFIGDVMSGNQIFIKQGPMCKLLFYMPVVLSNVPHQARTSRKSSTMQKISYWAISYGLIF